MLYTIISLNDVFLDYDEFNKEEVTYNASDVNDYKLSTNPFDYLENTDVLGVYLGGDYNVSS